MGRVGAAVYAGIGIGVRASDDKTPSPPPHDSQQQPTPPPSSLASSFARTDCVVRMVVSVDVEKLVVGQEAGGLAGQSTARVGVGGTRGSIGFGRSSVVGNKGNGSSTVGAAIERSSELLVECYKEEERDGSLKLVYTTETRALPSAPDSSTVLSFAPFILSASELCGGDYTRKLILRCLRKDREAPVAGAPVSGHQRIRQFVPQSGSSKASALATRRPRVFAGKKANMVPGADQVTLDREERGRL